MFETFNVPGMYIGVQAVLALIASRLAKNAEKVFSSDLDGKKIYHSMIRYLEEIAADGSIDKNR